MPTALLAPPPTRRPRQPYPLQSMRGGLRAVVAELCDEASATVDGPLRDAVSAVRADLDEPLRVALVGRVKAGKSTLLNALIGRRVAPTDVSECTRVVTWFSYNSADRAEVVLRAGGTVPLQLDPAGT